MRPPDATVVVPGATWPPPSQVSVPVIVRLPVRSPSDWSRSAPEVSVCPAATPTSPAISLVPSSWTEPPRVRAPSNTTRSAREAPSKVPVSGAGPPSPSRSLPTVASTTPAFWSGTPSDAPKPVPAVLAIVPVLTSFSAGAVKSSKRKRSPSTSICPWFSSVRPPSSESEPPNTSVAPGFTRVTPVPVMSPPVHASAPVTSTVPAPAIAPLSSLLPAPETVTVPLATPSVAPCTSTWPSSRAPAPSAKVPLTKRTRPTVVPPPGPKSPPPEPPPRSSSAPSSARIVPSFCTGG